MDPAGVVPPPPTINISSLLHAEHATDRVAELLRGSTGRFCNAALFEPRQHNVVVDGVHPLRDAQAILARADFAQKELGWEVRGRPLLSVVVRIDMCLQNIAPERLPPVVLNVDDNQAIDLLRRQGRRLLTLAVHFSGMRGHDPHLVTFAFDVFARIQQVTDYHTQIGPAAAATLLHLIHSMIDNARRTHLISFFAVR